MSFKVFTDDDKRENVVSTVAEPMWTDGATSLTTFFTGSIQDSNNGKYYKTLLSLHRQSQDKGLCLQQVTNYELRIISYELRVVNQKQRLDIEQCRMFLKRLFGIGFLGF